MRREVRFRRTWAVAAVLLVVVLGSAGAAVVYSGVLGGGGTSTSCGAGGCATAVTSTTTTTTTQSTLFSSVFRTTTTVTATTPFTLTTTTTTVTQSGNVSAPRLGFWLQEGDVMQHYSAQTFFNAMFLTPPYPSSVEVMIFAISQAEVNNQPCSSGSSYISASESYWGQVAQLADGYPNIRLVYEIAYDPSNSGTGSYGLSCFQLLVNSFAQYPSIYGLGVEGEYTRPASALSAAEVQTAMGYVTGAGKVFVNYFVPQQLLPSGSFDIYHTNFPGGDAGGYDQVGTLSLNDPHTIGMDSGYYSTFTFPGTVTCPIGASAMNSGTAGWNQCVEQTELSTALSQPPGTRQFLEVDVGFSPSYFTGVSGQSTNQVWDNPTLRNWFWTDPAYASHFVLSTPA